MHVVRCRYSAVFAALLIVAGTSAAPAATTLTVGYPAAPMSRSGPLIPVPSTRVGPLGAPVTANHRSAGASAATSRTTTADQAREVYSYSFRNTFGNGDGATPEGTPVEDAAGSVYGTTNGGGEFSFGTVFKFSRTPQGIRESVIYSFGAAGGSNDGLLPAAGPIIDRTGALFGTTTQGGYQSSYCGSDGFPNYPSGCGTVYKLTPTAQGRYIESILYRFLGGNDGIPQAELTLDRYGALYGTASVYTGSANGNVFKLTPTKSGYSFSILYAFHRSDGDLISSKLLLDERTGALYGTTQGLGTVKGAVFKLTPTSSGYVKSIIYSGPFAAYGLIMDGTGAIYGISGTYVVKFTPTSGGYALTLIHRFSGGVDPYPTSFVLDRQGSLYGTSAPSPGNGTVFKLTPTSMGYKETFLYRFNATDDGTNPVGLLLDPSGFVVGTASSGGAFFFGTVFALK